MFLLGVSVCYFFVKERLHTVQLLDEETAQQNRKLQQQHSQYQEQINSDSLKLQSIQQEYSSYQQNLQMQKNHYEERQQLMQTSIEELQKNLNQNFEIEALKLSEEYEQEKEKLISSYLALQADLTGDCEQQLKKLYSEINDATDIISELREKESVIIEANRRKELIKQKEKYYQLQLSDESLQEINKIKEIAPYLTDPTPLYKVIWKVYYEKPYTDLIGRIFGSKKGISGIYKITDIENEKCYVGQAVDVAERFRQHIKRGLGAETPTKNKLYPAMHKKGPENFRFELLEECPRDQLNKKEDYWQDFYKAIDYGYSIK